jgi:glycosyltransferase involved in cell wall biosynthesis
MVDRASRNAGRARIALAHDWLCGRRGGEMVLERLAHLVETHFRPAPLYTMFDDGRGLSPSVDRLEHVRSWLSPGAHAGLRRWALPLYPAAVAHLSRRLARDHAREPIDLLISSSSAAIKGLRPPAGVPHLCYCHCPARYLWSRGEDYAEGSQLRALGLGVLGPWLRAWDAKTSAGVTAFIANSGHIRAEISRCYGRESVIVHPPVRTGFFTPDDGIRREDFWLIVGALEPYKRVDAAIGAARLASARLVIVGQGSERKRLERLASGVPGVEFLGRRTDEEVRELYRRARVLLFPQVEDFGIVAVEAQACGLPVAARRAGGALDTVTDQTGSFFDEPTPEQIARAAAAAPTNASEGCRRNAERFSEATFDGAMLAQIRALLPSKDQRADPALPV